MDERSRIAVLARVLSAQGAVPPGVDLGIGDDAAVLYFAAVRGDGAAGRIVWTIDEQVEGTHFERAWVEWRDVGWRSFMAAASDVAAMGANAWCALSALVLSDAVDDAGFEAIVAGQGDAAAAIGTRIVGGNLARGSRVSIATTVLGTCERAVARSGARPGDGVWLAGEVGLAAAGLEALRTGRGDEARLRRAVEAWRRPRALVAEGRAMGAVASAAVDVSDGLACDAARIGEASGVQIVLDGEAVAESASLVEAAAALGARARDLALHGGEDYALVVTSPRAIDGFRRVGEVRAGAGLVLRGPEGERRLDPRGFDHFAG
jgi:thiamine-monophosphate kinase